MSTSNTPLRPLVGLGVLVVRDGQILLGKRRNAHGEGDWSPPGGHLEFGESPEEGAAREVREETGLTIDDIRLVKVINSVFVAERKHYVTLFFAAKSSNGTPMVLEPEKSEAWGWYEWGKLPTPLFLPLRTLIDEGFSLSSVWQ